MKEVHKAYRRLSLNPNIFKMMPGARVAVWRSTARFQHRGQSCAQPGRLSSTTLRHTMSAPFHNVRSIASKARTSQSTSHMQLLSVLAISASLALSVLVCGSRQSPLLMDSGKNRVPKFSDKKVSPFRTIPLFRLSFPHSFPFRSSLGS